MYKVQLGPYNSNSHTYNLVVPFFNTGTVEEWLKFLQNLCAVIAGQNITDAQGTYVITRSLLHGDALIAFENAEGNNRPQTEPDYKQTMKDVYLHMPLYKHMSQKLDACVEH
eukprot:6622949-Ditylum_brightwellii.AAC.1